MAEQRPKSSRRRELAEDIRHINLVRGPRTPEEAAFYVEHGVLNPEEAAFLLENRRRLDDAFERDIKRLADAVRAATRGKRRIEDIPEARILHAQALKLRRENPGMTWAQIAARIWTPERTLYRLRERLGR